MDIALNPYKSRKGATIFAKYSSLPYIEIIILPFNNINHWGDAILTDMTIT